jgi:uracil-DNA glycosylase family 4
MVTLMGPKTQELKALYDAYTEDPAFEHLREEGINFVPGCGPIDADIMLVGEAPGRFENAKRQPFIGPSGHVLSDLLTDIEIDLYNDVFLTNVVKYWPRSSDRKTRTPNDEEILTARDYLLKEIEIIDPIFVGLCGRSSIKAVFPHINSVKSHHGKLLEGKFIPLYHPAAIGYNPQIANDVKMGFNMLKNLLDARESM